MTDGHIVVNENNLLQNIISGTASETGSRFFKALVKHLSQALGTYGAWITEYIPENDRLRAFAFWLNNDFVDHYEYDVTGTPCDAALKSKSHLHIPENVIELFPDDPDLASFGAVSYMGFTLLDPDGNILGNLAVVDTKPMPESYRNLAVFRIFAARATAEILRLSAEEDIRVRELKLNGVFNGVMDAIIEIDSDFKIRMINPAGAHIFGCRQTQCTGQPFEGFFTLQDRDRLREIVSQLKFRKRADRRIWIPEELTVLSMDKKRIPVEATISQIDWGDRPHFVVVLRDVSERDHALKTIASLRDETEFLKDEIQSFYNFGEIIGESRRFRKTLRLVSEVAPTDSTVLIYGETGTGKELIARAIHASSNRCVRPLITVNCAAIPEALMESEFFGHEKGAFTGATQRREGRFSLADGGTIFLDEVGELTMELQAKLLRVLQNGEFDPVGSARTRQTDVRVIAATNRDLSLAVENGQFRSDLYYRLNVFPITIPPLRKRGDDIRLLAEHFVDRFSNRMGRDIAPLGSDSIERLKAYRWAGNVRELQNVIERGVITARDGYINLDRALPEVFQPRKGDRSVPVYNPPASVKTALQFRQMERDNMILALEQSQWRVAGKHGSAHLLGIPPSTFQSKMKALGIHRPDPSSMDKKS